METVWIVIGFTIVNVAWIIALNMVLMAPVGGQIVFASTEPSYTGTLTIQSVEVTGTA